MTTDAWTSRLIERHTAAMTRPEFLKAVRALSARYVERRAKLPERSALDSAGKRAAFAAFYAPFHFFTTRQIIRRLGASQTSLDAVLDLGCGTGVAGAAWALECKPHPRVVGVDVSAWALNEARWNWDALDVAGRTKRGDLGAALQSGVLPRTGLILGWALNELSATARTLALERVLTIARQGVPIIVIEPIATRIVPWWPAWAREAERAGGRSDEWKFELSLPAALADLDEAAGFRRQALSARSVTLNLTAG